jgi:hypothetical protein
MFRTLKRMPLFRLLAIAKTVSLARRHARRLDRRDRRRLTELARKGTSLSAKERDELRRILGKLGPREFAFHAADAFSPVPLPRRLAGRTAR